MDIYASAALSGVGMALNNQRDTFTKQMLSPPHPSSKPSMNNVYSSDHWSKVRNDEFQRGSAMWNAAQQPLENGVVPRPAYASMFSAPLPEQKKQPIVTMAGEQLSPEAFTHNNMQPFFRGSARQNIDPLANHGKLEKFTGVSEFYQQKKEVECFFEPTANFAHVCGMPDNTDYYTQYIQPPVARRNDFPIEPIRVGPGLGQGFTARPDGGFQQANTLDYIRPKTVDELRVATKPKLSYEIPIQGPPKKISKRGEIGAFEKNRPDTYYEQTPDMLLRTTGAVTKETGRPVVTLKPTARVDTHTEYQGQAGATSGPGEAYDYGKSAIMIYDNERQVTQTRTVISNLTTTVKAIVAPLLDIVRHNTKEYMVDAPRVYGNMQAQIPSKPTTYDPVQHMMRTTIKETTIHDTNVANLKGAETVPAALLDTAKTTVRETLPVEDQVRNVSAHSYRVTVYNAEAAKKTVRETLGESGSMYGFVGGPVNESAGAYEHVDVQVPFTQKQFVSDYEYEGTAESKTDFRPRLREAEENAEIDGTREALNIASGHTPGGGGTYEGVNADMVDMASKKLVSDSIAQRNTGNVSRILQPSAVPIEACEITKPAAPLLNGHENRLDPGLLSALKSNPYNLSINPI